MTTTVEKSVPANALTFKCGEFAFDDMPTTDEKGAKLFPFTMKARSSGVLTHWYWGRIVHDMEGMQLRKPTCPIDYCHDCDEIIGVGKEFKTDNDGLTVSGHLVALSTDAEDDRAFEVAMKAKNEIPYEASIDWRGPGVLIEEVGEGMTTKVNGQTIDGPVKVVRKWPLRAVAVCPYGQDQDTRTEFSATQSGEQISICTFTVSGEHPVKLETSPAAPTQQHSETPAPSGVSLDTIKQFNQSFGPKAGEYLAAGLTFSDAKLKFTEDRLAAAEAENKQLKEAADKSQTQSHAATEAAKLLGEAKPVETGKGADAGGKKTFSDMFRVQKHQG